MRARVGYVRARDWPSEHERLAVQGWGIGYMRARD